ncbi:hypothetical protein EV715DRAFT_260638 [Schizophyllum commune]
MNVGWFASPHLICISADLSQNRIADSCCMASDQPRYTASDVDYEQKYAPDPHGEGSTHLARVWSVYNDEAQIADRERVDKLNGTLDVLLVFAGLFSAAVTTFVSQSSQALSPDYAQITASLVYELVLMQRAAASGGPGEVPASPLSVESKTHQTTDLWVNALWLISLVFALATALIAVLAKQWIQHFDSRAHGATPRERACIRQYRLLGFERWKVPSIIAVLPALLAIALLLFLAGLTVYVAPMDTTLFLVILVLTGSTIGAYVGRVVLPILVPHCAYKTPITDYVMPVAGALVWLAHKVYHYVIVRGLGICGFSFADDRLAMARTRFLSIETREAHGMHRMEEDLGLEVLRWLAESSSNVSAARMAIRATATYIPRYHNSLSRELEEFWIASVNRLMRHWTGEHWQWLLGQWDTIPEYNPNLRVLVLAAALLHVFFEEDALLDKTALRRALHVLGSQMRRWLCDIRLHPVVWHQFSAAVHGCSQINRQPAGEYRERCHYPAYELPPCTGKRAQPKIPASISLKEYRRHWRGRTAESDDGGKLLDDVDGDLLSRMEDLERLLSKYLAHLEKFKGFSSTQTAADGGRAVPEGENSLVARAPTVGEVKAGLVKDAEEEARSFVGGGRTIELAHNAVQEVGDGEWHEQDAGGGATKIDRDVQTRLATSAHPVGASRVPNTTTTSSGPSAGVTPSHTVTMKAYSGVLAAAASSSGFPTTTASSSSHTASESQPVGANNTPSKPSSESTTAGGNQSLSAVTSVEVRPVSAV